LKAWKENSNNFGKEVMKILEQKLGKADLEESLTAPLEK
jgi:hypothetical protein